MAKFAMHFTEQATLTRWVIVAPMLRSIVTVIRSDGPLWRQDLAGLIGHRSRNVQEDVNTYKVNFEYALNDDVLVLRARFIRLSRRWL